MPDHDNHEANSERQVEQREDQEPNETPESKEQEKSTDKEPEKKADDGELSKLNAELREATSKLRKFEDADEKRKRQKQIDEGKQQDVITELQGKIEDLETKLRNSNRRSDLQDQILKLDTDIPKASLLRLAERIDIEEDFELDYSDVIDRAVSEAKEIRGGNGGTSWGTDNAGGGGGKPQSELDGRKKRFVELNKQGGRLSQHEHAELRQLRAKLKEEGVNPAELVRTSP